MRDGEKTSCDIVSHSRFTSLPLPSETRADAFGIAAYFVSTLINNKGDTVKAALTQSALVIAIATALPVAAEDQAQVLPELTVKGERPYAPLQSHTLLPAGGERSAARDSATLLERAPGAAVVRNGQQTGIVQLRGLFNDRVRVLVDDMTITPACANHMDPPLHYVSAQGVDTMEIIAGITPVSQGGDSIAGTVIARSAPPTFADADAGWTSFGRLYAGYNGSNDSDTEMVQVGAADDRTSLSYTGEHQNAEDLKFAGGTVADSGYRLTKHDLRFAQKAAGGMLMLDAGEHSTRDAGTPSLPMDMIEDDAKKIALGYQGEMGGAGIELKAYRHEIDHLMDNYSLRPNPMPAMHAFAPATSDDTGAKMGVTLARGDTTYRLGAEYLHNAFDSYSQRLLSSVRQDIFRDNTRERFGLYAEQQVQHGARWQTLVGVRSDTVKSDAADIVNAGASTPMLLADQAAFNARAHDITDHNWDVTLLTRYAAGPGSEYEFGVARKTRSPSLIERYLWTNSNASAGQADGRQYIGNLDLNPEVSHQVSLGANWHGDDWRVAPNVFYNRVSDYIQGTPIARTDMNGLPVLQYTNLDRADLYGIDGAWHYGLTKAWRLRGTMSYVRGENKDNGDNLYRIAPLRGDIAADYSAGRWTHTAELRGAARQDKVSAYNGETPTPGYGITNLRTAFQLNKATSLHAGVENVFDKYYVDHLNGTNRVPGGDVAIGSRTPGAGRFYYVSGEYRW